MEADAQRAAGPIASAADAPTDKHYTIVARNFSNGLVVPFLGSGVNVVGDGDAYVPGQRLPSAQQLAKYLATSYRYPEDQVIELARVAEYVDTNAGWNALYAELRAVFDADYPISPVHRFLAEVPELLGSKGYRRRFPLIVTTNYDDVLEHAFQEAGQEVDVAVYIVTGPSKGKFVHFPPGATEPVPIPNPVKYKGFQMEFPRPVILKIHGAVNRLDPTQDSYVITEDHYIDYLTHTDISALVPPQIVAKLKNSNLLFLGYSLRDWNLRVILHRLWGSDQQAVMPSWAVQHAPNQLDKEFWDKRKVEIFDINLDEYVQTLKQHIQSLEDRTPAAAPA